MKEFYERDLERAKAHRDEARDAGARMRFENDHLQQENGLLVEDNTRLNNECNKQFVELEGAREVLKNKESALAAVEAFSRMEAVDETGEEGVCEGW